MSVQPRLGAGLKDYLPGEMIVRQEILDTIRGVFERFGFSPLGTPGLELVEVLTGGDPNFDKDIFRAQVRDRDDGLALRFDLTVPLARVVAQYPVGRPFKRYQLGSVWRGEKPQAGRFREFLQFDADTIGSAEMTADAETVSIIYETLCALGISNFRIRVNNRKILNGLPEFADFDPGIITDVLRLLDKVENLGWEDNVAAILADEYGFNSEQLARLKAFIDFRGGDQVRTLQGLRELLSSSEIAMDGIRELEELTKFVGALGVPDNSWLIDPSIARGLGYYTGPVFETQLVDLPSIGSVFSGGRFDGLVGVFGANSVPAVGASIGVDRLFEALSRLGLIDTSSKTTVAEVLVLDIDPNCRVECQRIAQRLRNSQIKTEFYMGKDKGFGKQLGYASNAGIKVAVVLGGRELDQGIVKIKNLDTRDEVEVPIGGCVEKVFEFVSSRRENNH